MKLKTSLALVASALLLASCGGGGSTTPPVDPLTLSLNLTGKSDNAPAVTSDTQLTGYFRGQSYMAGILKPDKSVEITVTPQLIATMPQRTYQQWKDSLSTCDTSKLAVTKDAKYFSVGSVELTVSGTKYMLSPSTKPQTSGSVRSYDEREYVYAEGAVEVSGTITCGTNTYTYAYSFQPGWNVVALKYSYDTVAQKSSTYVRTTLGQGNVQTMEFVRYNITQ